MRLKIIEPDKADNATKKIFKKLVMVPNVICQMANSPPLIETYTNYHMTLDSYKLSSKFRKMISLAVSQFNDCTYCIALHTTTATEGDILSKAECIEARRMKSADPQADAVLSFTKAVMNSRGKIDDISIEKIKSKGFDDQEIVEMIAMISFVSFANYIANVGEPELDFLEPPPIN